MLPFYSFPTASVTLPSNLRDTTKVKSFTQEARLSSSGDGPLQYVFGVFYANTDRVYAQRLPTPGYDAFTDAVLGAGTSAAVANGFGPNSPFNSDLPYNLKQLAVFGEGSYELFDALTVTAGGRYYDFKERRLITTGGRFGYLAQLHCWAIRRCTSRHRQRSEWFETSVAS